MTIEDALKAMSTIEGQADGTEARAVVVTALNEKLLTDPDDFWDFYFETLNAASPNATRDLAERLLKSGAVHGGTTLADLPAILADDRAA